MRDNAITSRVEMCVRGIEALGKSSYSKALRPLHEDRDRTYTLHLKSIAQRNHRGFETNDIKKVIQTSAGRVSDKISQLKATRARVTAHGRGWEIWDVDGEIYAEE